MKALLAAVFAALVLAPAGNAAYTKTDQFVTMDDGVGIATTLYLPDAPGPRPAVMLFHGIGGQPTVDRRGRLAVRATAATSL